uniref:CRAL-TRIO domain-containing protein n=2 Tax=Aegilops tauschii subsp. strangulata TaxID=200361 RepID=A0A453H904_AEGTS
MFSRKHASHFNSDDAEQRQAKPDVSVEAEMGKMYRATFTDKEGRTVVIMRPAKQVSSHRYLTCSLHIALHSLNNILRRFQNTSSHEGQLRHLIYTMENAVLSLPQGLDKMVWLVDYTGWTLANATPIKTARDSTNILQNHYPERLSVAFLFNPPKVFESFFKV